MKKYLLLLLLALFLIGCGTNSDYIETTKSIILPNKILNANSIEDLTKEILGVASGENVEKDKIKWEVQGNTKNGKVVSNMKIKNVKNSGKKRPTCRGGRACRACGLHRQNHGRASAFWPARCLWQVR